MKHQHLALFLLFLSPLMGIAQKKYNPEIKLNKGDTLIYLIQTNVDMTQSMMGQDINMNVSTQSKNIITVNDIDKNDYYHLSQLSKEMKVNMKMDQMDSTMFIPDINNLPVLVMSKKGNILHKVVSTNEKGQTMGNDFGDVTASSPFIEFPDRKISESESWETLQNDTVNFMGGDLITNAKTVYTLIGTDNKEGVKCLKVNHKTTANNEGTTNMQGMDFAIEGTTVMEGTTWIDSKTGIPVFIDGTAESQMTLLLSGQQNMTIPLTYKTTFTKKLLK